MKCLDDAELLALVASLGYVEARSGPEAPAESIERRMTATARELAYVHLDACRLCLDLVTALLRTYEESATTGRAT